MSKFKVGDRVYCPMYTGRVCKLVSNGSYDLYPLCISGIQDCFTATGKRLDGNLTSNLFHATPENHALLSQLYPNVEFEKPKAVGSDLTRQMLADGAKKVLCWVSDTSDDHAFQVKDISVVMHLCDFLFFDKDANNWRYAVPIPRNYYAMDDSDE